LEEDETSKYHGEAFTGMFRVGNPTNQKYEFYMFSYFPLGGRFRFYLNIHFLFSTLYQRRLLHYLSFWGFFLRQNKKKKRRVVLVDKRKRKK